MYNILTDLHKEAEHKIEEVSKLVVTPQTYDKKRVFGVSVEAGDAQEYFLVSSLLAGADYTAVRVYPHTTQPMTFIVEFLSPANVCVSDGVLSIYE